MHKGVLYGLGSAVLFGISTPVAKMLVGAVSPLMLAGLLYAGSGVGLLLLLGLRSAWSGKASRLDVPRGVEWAWLAGAIFFGGVMGPVALMHGLRITPASTTSLLLNLESVFTALLAWFLFHENFDRRIALGMSAIVLGGVVLAWTPDPRASGAAGVIFIAAACLCWAIDNNLTRRTSTSDAVLLAGLKGAVAGVINLGLALVLGQRLPGLMITSIAALVGLVGYGVSLVLFVLALRHLGTARAGAYFAAAPFFGAALAVVSTGDAITWQLLVAGALMATGVWLHVTEYHRHQHDHERLEHTHAHVHDDHHRHLHEDGNEAEPHSHAHVHEALVHSHPHYPDVHHRHRH